MTADDIQHTTTAGHDAMLESGEWYCETMATVIQQVEVAQSCCFLPTGDTDQICSEQ